MAVVLDLFSRRVVGWSMSRDDRALVIDALLMAIWRRGQPARAAASLRPGQPIHQRGVPALLAEHGITCSMSRRGDVWDNSAMESFFSSLKIERVQPQRYRTRDEARADVFDYIERFYNPRRRHSTIGYLSPAEYENATGSA